jgi:hypothetical protein
VPWSDLLDILADAAVDLRRQRQHAPCDGCGGTGVADGARCLAASVWTPAGEWGTCPYGLMTLAFWRGVVGLDAVAMVAPLAGWPDAYTAPAVDALLALRAARMRAEAAAAKRAAERR